MSTERQIAFLQRDADRREIFLVTTSDAGSPIALGPLPSEQVLPSWYADPRNRLPGTQAEAALAVDLRRRAGEYHDLDDYFRFYGYPDDVVAWVETTITRITPHDPYTRLGRSEAEVAERLGLDLGTLAAAAYDECVAGWPDPEGNPVFFQDLGDNWALGSLAGVDAVNPRALRFKAWLSFQEA